MRVSVAPDFTLHPCVLLLVYMEYIFYKIIKSSKDIIVIQALVLIDFQLYVNDTTYIYKAN